MPYPAPINEPPTVNQPPGGATFLYRYRQGDYNSTTSEDKATIFAKAQAIAQAKAWSDWTINSPVADYYFSSSNEASYTEAQYCIAVLTPTCWISLIWQEVTQTINDYTGSTYAIAGKSETVTPAAVDGYCLPSGWLYSDETTWSRSATYSLSPTFDPTDGVGGVTIYASTSGFVSGAYPLVFSFLSDYAAPIDGSHNGLPAPSSY